MHARLPAKLWVKARLALWNKLGYPAVLRRRGDSHGGSIIISVDRCNGDHILLGQQRALDDTLTWIGLGSGKPLNALDEQAYLDRAIQRDRDIWIIGVEVISGWPPLDEPVNAA